MAEKVFYREALVGLLEEIASERPLTSESDLVCRWFDGLYLSAFKSEGYTAEVWTRGLKDFESCFASHELKALADFDKLYDQWHRSGEPDWTPVRARAPLILKALRMEKWPAMSTSERH